LYNLDHAYILAFSMIMLHTDAFNKSNKRKMTKADYIKNVKPLGIAAEVLDVSFINGTVFPPLLIACNASASLTTSCLRHSFLLKILLTSTVSGDRFKRTPRLACCPSVPFRIHLKKARMGQCY
jgi:hypothetical protein